MTTPRDLLMIAMDVPSSRPVEQGDLSLALAGAELVDLIEAQAITLEDDDRIVPGAQWTMGDRLLDGAVASLVRERPYESVDDWLWRRGRGLSAAYRADLEAEGRLTRPRHRWIPFGGRTEAADSPDRSHADERWTAGEPILTVLAAAVGIHDESTEEAAGLVDDSVLTVLAAVNGAVTELEAVRQRRSIEDAAFDNIWRGGDGT